MKALIGGFLGISAEFPTPNVFIQNKVPLLCLNGPLMFLSTIQPLESPFISQPVSNSLLSLMESWPWVQSQWLKGILVKISEVPSWNSYLLSTHLLQNSIYHKSLNSYFGHCWPLFSISPCCGLESAPNQKARVNVLFTLCVLFFFKDNCSVGLLLNVWKELLPIILLTFTFVCGLRVSLILITVIAGIKHLPFDVYFQILYLTFIITEHFLLLCEIYFFCLPRQ